MKIKLEVTEEDIRNGRPRSTWACPIAQAFNREFLGDGESSYHSAVDPFAIHVYDCSGFEIITVRLSRKATKFVDRFDDTQAVKPCSFTLDVKE